MTLIVDELYDGITFEQNFRIDTSQSVAHIRPWIYKHGNPTTGTLKLQVWGGSDLLKEASLTSAEINAAIIGTYAHGQIRFDFEPLQLNHSKAEEYTEYTLKLFIDGYTTDENNFYGAVRSYERKFYETYGDDVVDGEPPNDMIEPLGFEIFEYIY